MNFKTLIILLVFKLSFSQSINLNQSDLEELLRRDQLLGNFKQDLSFTIRPIISNNFNSNKKYLQKFFKQKNFFLILPIDFISKYSFASFYNSSENPYDRNDILSIPRLSPNNRNDGSLIPARGFQQLLSFGIYAEIGHLSVQLKPEYLYAENLYFQRFWTDHQLFPLDKRFNYWNSIDTPERFGEKQYSRLLPGQSSIRFNYKKLSLGFSTENIWWGPATRNSIMMSNNARGFPHITFNTTSPIKTSIGNFEFQLISGKLEGSGYKPTYTNFDNDKFYQPKNEDWRYFQGMIFTYSPKFINGLSLGFIRWVQMYGDFLKANNDYFPVFNNIFNLKSKNIDILELNNPKYNSNKALGLFLSWNWNESNSEIYLENYLYNSSNYISNNLANNQSPLASTIGFKKIFKSSMKDKFFEFNWEWTQLEQSSSRLKRNIDSWYTSSAIRHGYTNYGEVMGASLGPGSNSHYFSIGIKKIDSSYNFGFEIIDQNNDWFIKSFESAKDFRRYWKDYNFIIDINRKFKKIWAFFNITYSRNLNYQWELDDYTEPYYHPGNDINNFHSSLKIIYLFSFKK
jgi:hypothetical protein